MKVVWSKLGRKPIEGERERVGLPPPIGERNVAKCLTVVQVIVFAHVGVPCIRR